MTTTEPPSETTATILIVEDDHRLVELYQEWLDDDYNLRIANTGREALSQMDDTVDVVLLDRRLPTLSGSEVLKEIRSEGYECRIAMITGVTPTIDVVSMGFDDYLRKPITQQQLIDLLDSLLARRTYDTHLQKLFALESKRRLLETEYRRETLESHEEYHELCAEIETTQDVVDTHVQSFDADDYEAAFLTLSTPTDED